MEYTGMRKEEIKEKFAARKRNQIAITVPIIGMILLLVFSEGKEEVFGVPIVVLAPVIFVGFVGALVFSLKNWRCPGCNKYLGKGMSPKFCAKCGVQLS